MHPALTGAAAPFVYVILMHSQMLHYSGLPLFGLIVCLVFWWVMADRAIARQRRERQDD